jgi:hypothetical protein
MSFRSEDLYKIRAISQRNRPDCGPMGDRTSAPMLLPSTANMLLAMMSAPELTKGPKGARRHGRLRKRQKEQSY